MANLRAFTCAPRACFENVNCRKLAMRGRDCMGVPQGCEAYFS